MKLNELSITFHTEKIKECVEFYGKYFNAKITFDCEWYVVLRLESNNLQPILLCFQNPTADLKRNAFSGGVSLNLCVDDVDLCYTQLKERDVVFEEKITDHEWGDRAFSLFDPIGNLLYIYSEKEITEQYQDALKE